MSCSTEDANKSVFEPIIKEVEQFGEIHDKNCIIFPASSQKEEKAFFEKLNLLHFDIIVFGKKFALIEYNKDDELRKFLVVTNLHLDESIVFDTTQISVCNEFKSAFFLFLTSKDVIEVKKDQLNVLYDSRLHTLNDDQFEYYSNKIGKIRKHKLEDLEDFFEDFLIFELTQSGDLFDTNGYRSLLYLLCMQMEIKWLPYEVSTIESFQNIAICGSESTPYEYIMAAMTTTQWKYAFKDLYRCIERLYPISKITELQDEFKCLEYDDSFKIAGALEKTLGWRLNEPSALLSLLIQTNFDIIESIAKLLLDASSAQIILWNDNEDILKQRALALSNLSKKQSIKEKLCLKICNCSVSELVDPNLDQMKLEKDIDRLEKLIKKQKIEFVATEIYQLRNSFVHYREYLMQATDKYKFTSNEWNELIRQMLNIILDLYNTLMTKR